MAGLGMYGGAFAKNRIDNAVNDATEVAPAPVLRSTQDAQNAQTIPASLGSAMNTPPPARTFSDDQQYMRDTASRMYGKGQTISPDMRDYYSQKWSDSGMDFNSAYPAPPVPAAMGNDAGLVVRPSTRPARPVGY